MRLIIVAEAALIANCEARQFVDKKITQSWTWRECTVKSRRWLIQREERLASQMYTGVHRGTGALHVISESGP